MRTDRRARLPRPAPSTAASVHRPPALPIHALAPARSPPVAEGALSQAGAPGGRLTQGGQTSREEEKQ